MTDCTNCHNFINHTSLISMPVDAQDHNEMVFSVFRRKLAGDPDSFTTTADLLARWLSSSRAYYLRARPTIVNLLETNAAQMCSGGLLPKITWSSSPLCTNLHHRSRASRTARSPCTGN
ncbi:hypothetical protein OBBRIDRAFT_563824 [Obba rivulosa]|uniref:Uncharacterized protein n=1 Tax=Obba rivulosa TaxID=1052685 RepID=A0A8E2AFK3_9APHY|nr:hypothetical protein OBBRIDRAFT_563824 [Obba rivulosa]